jgi:GNAT superfamily N-acetyltransferase
MAVTIIPTHDSPVRGAMRGLLTMADEADAPAIAALQNAVAAELTARHGIGHWSSVITEKGVRASMRRASVFVVRDDRAIAATLTLATRKPWAIDRRYFTPVARPVYLLSMAVDPGRQRTGIGRACVGEALDFVRDWPADAICLDAYDAAAGAGEFYRKCGFAEVGRAEYRATPLIYFERLV